MTFLPSQINVTAPQWGAKVRKKANAKHCHKTAASVWANSYIQTSKSVNAAHIRLLWIILSANIKILAQRNEYWAFIRYNVTLLSKSKDLNQWWLHQGWWRLWVSSDVKSSCQSRPGKDCCSPGMMSSVSGLDSSNYFMVNFHPAFMTEIMVKMAVPPPLLNESFW